MMMRRSTVALGLVTAFTISIIVLYSHFAAGPASAVQATPKTDPWDQLRFLVGEWTGTGSGNSGNSTVERTYEFILGNQFLLVRNKSIFDPQEKNPKGELHEDLGVISYDTNRKKFILREFYSEGFVNQFVLEEISEDGKRLVFNTESVENGPPNMRARTTLEITGERELAETFELAWDGKTFKPCVANKMRRTG